MSTIYKQQPKVAPPPPETLTTLTVAGLEVKRVYTEAATSVVKALCDQHFSRPLGYEHVQANIDKEIHDFPVYYKSISAIDEQHLAAFRNSYNVRLKVYTAESVRTYEPVTQSGKKLYERSIARLPSRAYASTKQIPILPASTPAEANSPRLPNKGSPEYRQFKKHRCSPPAKKNLRPKEKQLKIWPRKTKSKSPIITARLPILKTVGVKKPSKAAVVNFEDDSGDGVVDARAKQRRIRASAKKKSPR